MLHAAQAPHRGEYHCILWDQPEEPLLNARSLICPLWTATSLQFLQLWWKKWGMRNSPRSPNSSTPRAANMKNSSMKRRPRLPTWKEGEKKKEKKMWGGEEEDEDIHCFFFLQTSFLLNPLIQNLNCLNEEMTPIRGRQHLSLHL